MVRGRRLGAAVLPFVLLAAVLQVPAAHATFPGTNGPIAFVSGDFDIYTMNADGTNPTPITQTADKDHSPAWSPDGTKIAFLRCVDPCSGGTNRLRVWVMDANGQNAQQLTADAASDDYPPAWSPDGTKIAFSTLGSSDPANNGLFVMDANGTNPMRIDANPSLSPDWSPDGTKLAVQRGGDIWVMNSDGSSPSNLTNSAAGDYQPVWFPDGSKIVYTSNASGSSYDLYTIPPTGGTPTHLFTTNAANEYEPFPTPDGQSIVFESDGSPPGPAQSSGASSFSLISWAADGLSNGVILNGDGSDPAVATVKPPCNEITISPGTMTEGGVGYHYLKLLEGGGGTAPYTFAVTSGSLPPGLSLNGSNNQFLEGDPQTKGHFTFTIEATDSNGCKGHHDYAIDIVVVPTQLLNDFSELDELLHDTIRGVQEGTLKGGALELRLDRIITHFKVTYLIFPSFFHHGVTFGNLFGNAAAFYWHGSDAISHITDPKEAARALDAALGAVKKLQKAVENDPDVPRKFKTGLNKIHRDIATASEDIGSGELRGAEARKTVNDILDEFRRLLDDHLPKVFGMDPSALCLWMSGFLQYTARAEQFVGQSPAVVESALRRAKSFKVKIEQALEAAANG